MQRRRGQSDAVEVSTSSVSSRSKFSSGAMIIGGLIFVAVLGCLAFLSMNGQSSTQRAAFAPADSPAGAAAATASWQQHFDAKSNKKYWFNHDTGESSWTDPVAAEPIAHSPGKPLQAKASTPKPTKASTPLPTLPAGWKEHFDAKSNKKYWFNHDTGLSSWTHPSAKPAAKTAAKTAQPTKQPTAHSTPKATAAAVRPAAEQQVDKGWTKHHDAKSGRDYWFNHQSGVSTWEDPTKPQTAPPTKAATEPPPAAADLSAASALGGKAAAVAQADPKGAAGTTPLAEAAKGDGFQVHSQMDMKVQDYGCEGSDSPEVCHWTVATVDKAKATCVADHRCGAFVITRQPTDNGLYSTWLKMRDSRYAASYSQLVVQNLSPASNVDTYVVGFEMSAAVGPPANSGSKMLSAAVPAVPNMGAPHAPQGNAPALRGEVARGAPAPPLPSLDLSFLDTPCTDCAAAKFKHFAMQDMRAHDFDCMGSSAPGGCAFEMKDVQAAFDKCLGLEQCGAFAIFHAAGQNGLFTTWFKVKEYMSVANTLKPSTELSVFALKDMGPKPKFNAQFHYTGQYSTLPPVFGADEGVWDGTGNWPGPPPKSAFRADAARLDAVRGAMKHAWDGYVQYAWGQDELKPVSNRGSNWLGMGASIIDSLDTLWIMGLKPEFARARTWVATSFNININQMVSFFETTIRCLGGLIAAYEFSDDSIFLEKAKLLGDKLLGAFKTQSGYPLAQINLASSHAEPPTWTSGSVILAEIGTVQLEFKALSKHTGDPKYHNTAHAVYNKLEKITPPDGLCPLFLDPNSGKFSGSQISLGAMGDSYYEYLIKLYLYSKKTEPQYLRMYTKSLQGILSKLVFQSSPSGLTYVAEMNGGSPVHKMDHLACFVPGMLGIGAQDSPDPQRTIGVARGIAETCFQMYARQRSGVAPEFINFGGMDFNNGANHNLLRPEALEAMFIMFRLTGDPIYREWGWQMFLAFEESCRTSSGYSGLTDVTRGSGPSAPKDDTQQSFFLAETLKYAYLLFTDGDTIPLDEYVFNTEAHPLKMQGERPGPAAPQPPAQ